MYQKINDTFNEYLKQGNEIKEAYFKVKNEFTSKNKKEDAVIDAILLSIAIENDIYDSGLQYSITDYLLEMEKSSLRETGIEKIMNEGWKSYLSLWKEEIEILPTEAIEFLKEINFYFVRYDEKWGDFYYLFEYKGEKYIFNVHQDFSILDVTLKLTNEQANSFMYENGYSGTSVKGKVHTYFGLELDQKQARLFHRILGQEDVEYMAEECEKAVS